MIIGAIEYCSQHEISGWIYSPRVDLKGMPVLAFLKGACVGSGVIGNHRQDLAEAGLGDGHYGFHFWITLPSNSDPKSVVVTLENCEAFLKQREAVVGAQVSAGAPLLCGAMPDAAKLDWLRARGLVDAAQAAVLRNLSAFGAAQHLCDNATADFKSHVEGVLEALEGGPVTLGYVDLDSGPNFRERLLAHEEALQAGVFILHSNARSNFLVQEIASDGGAQASGEVPDFGAVTYFCDEQTALVLRRGAPFKIKSSMTAEAVRCYFPVSLTMITGDTVARRATGVAQHS